jgi:twitching motility two-component system response regulator PilG
MFDTFTSPYEALKAVASDQLCGHLLVTSFEDPSISWKIYVGGKRLHYASTTEGQIERMSCLWERQLITDLGDSRLDPATLEATFIEALKFQATNVETTEAREQGLEYTTLYKWQRLSRIPLNSFKLILLELSTEALIHALSMRKAKIHFYQHTQPDPILLAVALPDLIRSSLDEIRRWQALKPGIPSPFTRFYLDPNKIDDFNLFWENLASPDQAKDLVYGTLTLECLNELLKRRACLYEITREAALAPIRGAQILQNLVVAKVLSPLPFRMTGSAPPTQPQPEKPLGPVIACIDDSSTVQRQVKLILEKVGYQVLSITEPANSLTALVRQKPSLILMDINMPEINGYELCGMLRQSRNLRDVPVVMLTGRDGLVDRLRSQMMGVVNYLTKPVQPEQLIEVVQKQVPINQ